MSWKDEEELILISIVASILFMTVLDLQVGAIYTGMISAYFMFLRKPYTYQFSRDKKYFTPAILVVAIVAIMVYYLLADTLNLPMTIKSIIGFGVEDISITNPLLKTAIWIFFIPLAETLFFFGLLFGYMKYKFRKVSPLMFIVFGLVLTVFHLLSQEMTQEVIFIDIIFGTISGLVLIKYNELKYVFWIHVLANIIGFYVTGGLSWLLS